MNTNTSINQKKYKEIFVNILVSKIFFFVAMFFLFFAFLYNAMILFSSAIYVVGINSIDFTNVLFASLKTATNSELIYVFNVHFYVILVFIFIGLLSIFIFCVFYTECDKKFWKYEAIPYSNLAYMFLSSSLIFIVTLGLTPKIGATNYNDNYFFANVNFVYFANSISTSMIGFLSSQGIQWPFYLMLILCIFMFIYYISMFGQNLKIIARRHLKKQSTILYERNKQAQEVKKNNQVENKEEKKYENLNTNVDPLFFNNNKSDQLNREEVEMLIKSFLEEKREKERKINLSNELNIDFHKPETIDENLTNKSDEMLKLNEQFKKERALLKQEETHLNLDDDSDKNNISNFASKDKIIANLENDNFEKLEVKQTSFAPTTSVPLPTIRLKSEVAIEKAMIKNEQNKEKFTKEKLEEITQKKLESVLPQKIVKIKETRGPLITKVDLPKGFLESLKQEENVVVKETQAKVINKKKESFIDKEIKERLKKFYE